MRQLLYHKGWLVVTAMMAMTAVAQVRDTIDFDINDRTLETITIGNETFNRYSFPDCDHIDQVGAPVLPVKYIRLSVPYNATNITVTGAGNWTSGTASRRIYPAPVPLTTNDPIPEEPELVIDSAIYMTNAFWPAAPAELVGEGFYMGENRIVTVAVYPMLYNPGVSRMRNYSQVRVTVSYNLGGTPANMLVRRGGDLRLQEQQAVKTMVENSGQVEGFAVTAAQAQHMPAHGLVPDSLLTDTASYHYGGELYTWGDRARYLIVTTRDLAPSFKRLAALKRQKGYSVQIKCIEDILADPRVQDGDVFVNASGDTISTINDDAGKLRQYLKLAYAYDNTQFVLMGGKNVPYRSYMNVKYDSLGNVIRDSIPTDLYYSDITYKWGKSLGYTPEYYWCTRTDGHELLVGRLMASSKEHINNYTDKLMRYELNPGHGDRGYLDRCLVVEGSELNPNLSTGTIMANAYSQITPETTLIIQQGHNYPSGEQVINNIRNHNYGILSIHGHGSPYTIATNNWNMTGYTKTYQRIASLNRLDMEFQNNGLDLIQNKYFPSIFYSWACNNAPFDVYYEPYLDKHYTDWNMAESYLLGKDYGGVIFLGNTRYGYYSSSNTEELLTNSPKLEKTFAQLLSSGTYRIAEAEVKSKEYYSFLPLESYSHGLYLLLTHNLHGDPELMIWPGRPISFANISVMRRNNSIMIEGLPELDDVIVSILSNQKTTHQLFCSSGSATLTDVNPNSTIMVCHHNYLPYIAPLYLQNERITRSQYVIANDVCAGRNVDPDRTAGDLTIASGVEYEIDAKGQVVFAPGFSVEKGALFSVTQSDY